MNLSLRNSPDALAVAADRVAGATGIPMPHVEKDFWVTEVLRGIAKRSADTGVCAVLKGGTSLSKAFGLIRRFSEDVDMLIVVPGQSKGMVDSCLKSFVAAAEDATGLTAVVDPDTATKGVKRTVTLTYPTETPPGALRPGVLLELRARGDKPPTVQRSLISLVAQHGPRAGLDLGFAEATPLTMNVLVPVRTLVEKLMIVHHAAAAENEAERARLARHYYDIWCLLNDNDTVEALTETPAGVLAREIADFSRTAGLKATDRPPDGFASSAAFDPAAAQAAKAAFETIVLDQLVWPGAPRPTFEECCALVGAKASVL
ncbi:MAG: nucleotidyl transferase AbiEii/AbiGii toxin family protein [bacterium]|nr:nucleotidyl transferase AbiEii/AbiGii toxin family protein [bacterium]